MVVWVVLFWHGQNRWGSNVRCLISACRVSPLFLPTRTNTVTHSKELPHCYSANENLRRYQYYGQVDWPGGIYISTGFNGSKSGGLFAATWAAMVHYGKEGYMNRAKKIFEINARLKNVVRSIPELKLFGDSLFITAIGSDHFKIYHVNDYLKTKGWRMNGQQKPDGFHFCITGPQITNPGIVEEFEKDLKAAVEYAKVQKGDPKSAAMYGGAGREIDPIHVYAYAYCLYRCNTKHLPFLICYGRQRAEMCIGY
jgi:hypothetical protein